MTTKKAPLQSLVTFRNSAGEAARGTLLKFERTTVVFEVYNPYSVVQLSEVSSDLTIRRGDEPIYQGRAIVSDLVNTGLMLIVSARFMDPWNYTATSLTSQTISVSKRRSSWNSGILQAAYAKATRSQSCRFDPIYSELNHWLQRLEAENAPAVLNLFDTYDGLLQFASPLLEKIQRLNRAIELEACALDEAELGPHRAFAQRELHPLIMSSPYPHRTYNKPSGYAGDYEMMNMIHREVPGGGPVPYAKLVNAAYVRLPIAESVRNRARYIEEYLIQAAEECARQKRTFSALSVGCGPAIEVQRFIRYSCYAQGAQMSLMDFNAETLEFAQDRIRRGNGGGRWDVDVRFIRMSVDVLLKNASRGHCLEEGAGYDFVYCAGLFDYLSDKVCARLVRLFYTWTRPGGRLLVTNMHEGTLNRYLLEHQAEWFLIYRNEAQMLAMGAGLGPLRTFTDRTGINLCLEVDRIGAPNPTH